MLLNMLVAKSFTKIGPSFQADKKLLRNVKVYK